MNFLEHYTKKQIEEWVSQSTSAREVLLRMGRSANSGSNALALSVYLRENNIDTSHFASRSIAYTPTELFVENSTAPQNILRKHYRNGNYTEYKCAICGLEPVWHHHPLTLRLDHINGTSNDHRLENLRWVCPNCDSQLPTYGAKRKKQNHVCTNCGCPITAKSTTGLCVTCYWQHRRDMSNANKPQKSQTRVDQRSFLDEHNLTPNTLAQQILTHGFCSIGRKFGVSATKIRKVCRACGLPTTTVKLQEWYQQHNASATIRRIQQIDISSHQIIAEYATYGEAQRALNLSNMTTLAKACKNGKTAYGFLWNETQTQL